MLKGQVDMSVYLSIRLVRQGFNIDYYPMACKLRLCQLHQSSDIDNDHIGCHCQRKYYSCTCIK
jgi:hypothetical protein